MIYCCYTCKKEFDWLYPMDDYVYKKNHNGSTIYFCGWNCMRHFEKTHEVKKRGRKPIKKDY